MATTGTPRRSAPAPDPPRRAGGNGTGGGTPPGPNGRRRRPKKRGGFWYGVKLFLQSLLFLILIVVIAGLVFLMVQLRQAPAAIDLNFAPPGRTLIYSADGTELAELYLENRQVVPIERIPKNLQDATVAFEDKRFYEHQGVDFKGIARSIFQNVKSGNLRAEGGSTITQQLARNMKVEGLTREKSVQRKLKEWIVANQIEKSYTKQQILWMYLNYVNYGAGSFGVQAAARTYFGKDVSKLDLAQCALLAGLPNRPTDYNPYKNKTAARAQRDRVLAGMLDQHYITAAQYARAVAEKVRLAGPRPPAQGSRIFHAPYFTDYVIGQLKDAYGDDAVMAGNLVVYTTLNMRMQDVAEKSLEEGIARVTGRGPTQGCLVALDPKTGAIKAMVGGVDYKKSQFNLVTQARRQPGSSFKVITYAAAIDTQAVTENTQVLDARTTFGSGRQAYTPQDDSAYSDRRMDLRSALAYSVNVVAVKVLAHVGPPLAIRYARLLGVQSPLDPVLSLALGSSAVTPLEMAGVYETFADGGDHAAPSGLMRVEDNAGHLKDDFAPVVETKVLQKSTVAQLDDMLRAVVTMPKGTGAVVADVPGARGKTGTTQGHKDVWFIGYTPNLVCAVWAGHPTYKTLPDGSQRFEYGAVMAGNAWGSTVCAPIWRDFMLKGEPIFLADKAKERAKLHEKHLKAQAAPKKPAVASPAADKTPAADPAPPAGDGRVTVNVDDATGLLAPRGARHSHRERFDRGAEPTALSPQYDTAPAPSDSGVGPGAATPADTQSAPLPAPPAPAPPSPAPVDAAPARASAPRPVAPAPDPPRPAPVVTAARPAPVVRVVARPAPRVPSAPRTVTVRVNPEDGLLATQWDPEVVERTYTVGTQPRRYSPMYRPPPGER